MSSTSERAACTTIRPVRSGAPSAPAPREPSSLAIPRLRAAQTAGNIAATMPTASTAPPVKASAVASSGWPAHSYRTVARSTRPAATATPSAAAPESAASTRLSIKSRRPTPHLPAPSAWRTASSRRRAATRSISRFDTLAVATRSTTRATPPTTSGNCMSPAKDAGPRVLRMGPSNTVTSLCSRSGIGEPTRAACTPAVAAAPASCAVTPGARRTRGVRLNPLPERFQLLPLLPVAAICSGTHTSAALGSGPEKPGGNTPTISYVTSSKVTVAPRASRPRPKRRRR